MGEGLHGWSSVHLREGEEMSDQRHVRYLMKDEWYTWWPSEEKGYLPTSLGPKEVKLTLYEAFIFDEFVTANERFRALVKRLRTEERLVDV